MTSSAGAEKRLAEIMHRIDLATLRATSHRSRSAILVKRLDLEATCNELRPKPKDMHWSTYERLAERYDTYDTMWAMAVMRRFRIRRR